MTAQELPLIFLIALDIDPITGKKLETDAYQECLLYF